MKGSKALKHIWLKKFNSFRKADAADIQEYINMSPNKKLELMQYLRESYYKLDKKMYNESKKGLQRTIKIIYRLVQQHT